MTTMVLARDTWGFTTQMVLVQARKGSGWTLMVKHLVIIQEMLCPWLYMATLQLLEPRAITTMAISWGLCGFSTLSIEYLLVPMYMHGQEQEWGI